MKKLSVLAVAIIATATATLAPGKVQAQKYQGQSVVTGGAGYSLAGILFGIIQDGLNTTGSISSKKTPVIIGAYDYGITDRFSVGACYTFQNLTAHYTSYETTDASGNVTTINGDFTDHLSRQSIGIRPLFHFGDNDDLDTYIGARFSYVFWNYRSPRTDVSSTDLFHGFGSPVKPQAVFGTRYFLTDNIGVNAEFAIGSTYFMMFGVNARFGGGQ